MSAKDIIKKSVLEGFSMEMSVYHIIFILLVTVVLSMYIFYIYRCLLYTSDAADD